MKFKWLLFGVLPLLSGCLENTDFNNLDNLEYNGEWALPLFQVTLELSDVVQEDDYFTFDPDGGIRIIYEDDSIFGASASQFVVVPPQESDTIEMTSGSSPSIIEFQMAAHMGAKLTHIEISEGTLEWKLINPVSDSVEVRFTIANAEKANGDTAHFDFVGPYQGETSGSIDISGFVFNADEGVVPYNNMKLWSRVVNDHGAAPGTDYKLLIVLKDLVVDNAKGYFGDHVVNLPSGDLDLDITGFENFIDGLYLDNPIIELQLNGNVGVPFSVTPDMDGVNKVGTVVQLETNDSVYYRGPTNQGSWYDTVFVLDKNTSNIDQFIANVPRNIFYQGRIRVNPGGEAAVGGLNNFVTKDAAMYVGVKLELPLEIKTKDLLLEQEVPDIDLSSGTEGADLIEKLTMHFKVTNGFPFDADLQVIFQDSNSVSLDSVDVKLLTSAPVDAQGRVTQPTVTRSEIKLTKDQLNNLLASNKLNIRVLLNSYNDGQDVVKIYTDYGIKIAVGTEVELKVKPE